MIKCTFISTIEFLGFFCDVIFLGGGGQFLEGTIVWSFKIDVHSFNLDSVLIDFKSVLL